MTLTSACICLKNIFAPGQAYVALSRVKKYAVYVSSYANSFDNLQVTNFQPKDIYANESAVQFYKDIQSFQNPPLAVGFSAPIMQSKKRLASQLPDLGTIVVHSPKKKHISEAVRAVNNMVLPINPTTTSTFYAVAQGIQIGVFATWAECQQQVHHYPNAKFKKFYSLSDAIDFVKTNQVNFALRKPDVIDIEDDDIVVQDADAGSFRVDNTNTFGFGNKPVVDGFAPDNSKLFFANAVQPLLGFWAPDTNTINQDTIFFPNALTDDDATLECFGCKKQFAQTATETQRCDMCGQTFCSELFGTVRA